jgi:hypothetical protein
MSIGPVQLIVLGFPVPNLEGSPTRTLRLSDGAGPPSVREPDLREVRGGETLLVSDPLERLRQPE